MAEGGPPRDRKARQPTKAEAAAKAAADQARQPPGPVMVFVPIAVSGGIAEHPRLGDVLDISFLLPGGGNATCRMPPDYWPTMREEIDTLVADYEAERTVEGKDVKARATKSGIHLPGGVDVDQEAKAHQDLREGENPS